jgi:hypothetical protein
MAQLALQYIALNHCTTQEAPPVVFQISYYLLTAWQLLSGGCDAQHILSQLFPYNRFKARLLLIPH